VSATGGAQCASLLWFLSFGRRVDLSNVRLSRGCIFVANRDIIWHEACTSKKIEKGKRMTGVLSLIPGYQTFKFTTNFGLRSGCNDL
jgi:hypothetical protein